MSQTLCDTDFEIGGNTIHYPELREKPQKLAWRAFEAWVRQQHNFEETVGSDEDGFDPELQTRIEIKSAIRWQNGGDKGRIILRRHQHRAALEENVDYVVGLLHVEDAETVKVVDAARISAAEIDEWCGVPHRSWVPREGYYEMGIQWTDLPYITDTYVARSEW